MNHSNYIVRALFSNEECLLRGAKQIVNEACEWRECYSPKPLEKLDELWEQPRSRLPTAVFIAGLLGAVGGFGMQYYAMGVNYPHNVGGRPLLSWPLYLPITFELMVLVAASVAFIGLFWLLGLPRLHQPILESHLSQRISLDTYLIEAGVSQKLQAEHLTEQLLKAGAVETEIVKGGKHA